MKSILLSQKFPGELRKGDKYMYFLPADLFLAKTLAFDFNVQRQLETATLALGKFSAKIRDIPNIEMFLASYLNTEAVQSSRIEGTQTDIDEAFQEDEHEIAAEKRDDWRELRQYIEALRGAMDDLHELPMCNRVIKRAHRILLSHARGEKRLPGEYRRSQNWIGGSRPDNAHFVPPVHEIVPEAMGNLEAFIHDTSMNMPELIKIALIHYQFEIIHPFLDGNGRIGRMLIPLYLLERKILDKPVLYISNFFEKNRHAYYDALDQARESAAGIIRWVSFFLDGVKDTAETGMRTTEDILALRDTIYHDTLPKLKRSTHTGHELTKLLFRRPYVTSAVLRNELNITAPSAHTLIDKFVELGILQEITGKRRNRVFLFSDYLDILRNI